MNKIEIQFENCYGIGKLDFIFDFSNTNSFLVYAPNGTMKTSLAKTLKYFASKNAKEPCDQVYPSRIPRFDIKFDDNPVTSQENQILIIDPEVTNYDASHRISNFIASKELKENFDSIYGELDSQKNEFIKKLKNVSQSSDCETEIISTFHQDEKDNFFDILDIISPSLGTDHEKFDFRYNYVFDKKGNVKKFLKNHENDIDIYIQNYELLISQSDFFKKSENSFGTYQANEILKSIGDNSFFEAGHIFDLKGSVKITSADDLKLLLEEEITKIVNNPDLKEIFNKVDKAIGTNAELRAFKNVIEKNNLLLMELKDYDEFKKKVWLGYLSEIKQDAIDLHDFYLLKKQDLDILFSQAEEEVETWKILVDQFNTRFHVPFSVKLKNQKDVILKKELATLEFLYSDRDSEEPIAQDKEILFENILSRGEKRAFYILQILFDIESRKTHGDPTFLVFDDVADSFDYKNKYAIIEYIRDLHESGKFKILILTHNFDFYRTIASRLSLSRSETEVAPLGSVLMVTRNKNGEITLNKGEYVNDLFRYFLGKSNEEKFFISLIPFLRNIIEYTEGCDADYDLLTKCLHIKDDTNQILINNILDIWERKFANHVTKFQSITFGSNKVIDIIYETAENITINPITNEISLENKIALSIAIRLKAEEFMIKNIPNIDLSKINKNQTQELFKRYKESNLFDKNKVGILNKVILMTPENLHLNAFMYEPLVDISVFGLISLYNELKTI